MSPASRLGAHPRLSLLALALLAATPAFAQVATAPVAVAATAAETDEATELDEVLVIGQRADRVSSGATGLDLDIKETPQSISVVTAGQMRDFGADDINDALRLATGINVEEWETNRTNYMSRGFDIVNTQVDGVGMPNDWGIVTGAFDSYGYDKIEVIRGANGQLTGVGNASGTINFVRKRPTNERQGELGVSLGSWDNRRIEGDYSTPLTDDGYWAARVVAAYDEGDSYLDLLHDERLFLYGVVDGQLGDRNSIAIGYSFQDADTDGNLWGGLPFALSDGTQAEFPRNATTSLDWTRWDTVNHNAFVELTTLIGDRWTLTSTYTYRRSGEQSKLFYSWAENGLDPDTMLGVVGTPGDYGGKVVSNLGEVKLSGSYDAFGREHEAMFGLAAAHSDSTWDTRDADPYEIVMPAFPYATDAAPEPTWGERYVYDESSLTLRRAFGATRLALSDRFKAIVGFNYTWLHREGNSIYDIERLDQEQGKFSPYAGLTFAVTDRVMAYASYSDIYQPQDQRDIDYRVLEPTQGVNLEVGLKADWLDGRLLTSLAWFSAEQRGLATFAGYTLPDFIYYYEGVDVNSEGVEFEATGKLGEYTELVFGVTALDLEDPDGADTYPWVPRRTANLALSSAFASLPQLRLGIGGRWQSDVENFDDAQVALIRQDAYAVLHAFAEWQVNDDLSLRFNADNLTDKKYINSVYYVGYYGEPRNYSLSLDWRF